MIDSLRRELGLRVAIGLPKSTIAEWLVVDLIVQMLVVSILSLSLTTVARIVLSEEIAGARDLLVIFSFSPLRYAA